MTREVNNISKNNEKIQIPLKKENKDTIIPKSSKFGDAGADARIMGFKKIVKKKNKKELIEIKSETYTLNSLERIGCQLGFATAIPEGYYFKVVPRSGLALWEGLSIVNSPGTIDSDYRGEIGIVMINWGTAPFVIRRGDRIAQMVVSKVYRADLVEVDDLDVTPRGEGGFGHTGRK